MGNKALDLIMKDANLENYYTNEVLDNKRITVHISVHSIIQPNDFLSEI